MSNYILKDRWTIQIISPPKDEWSRIPLHRREGGGWTNDSTLAESFPTREAAQAKLVELINEGDIGDAYNVGVFQVVTVDFLYGAKPAEPKDNMETETEEICWLIEHHARPAWYGLACNGSGATWVPASMAVRFARKEDADAMIGIIGLDTDRYKATEHVFSHVAVAVTGLGAITPEMIEEGQAAVSHGDWINLVDLRAELAEAARTRFAEAAKPLIKYLNDNMEHPHYKVIVTNTGAELVEGSMSYKNNEFVKD